MAKRNNKHAEGLTAMSVSQLAAAADAPAQVVRYYSRRGLLVPVRNPENGYRQYSNKDITRLRFIRQAQSLGFTLNEIGEILHDAKKGHSPCLRVRTIIGSRIIENRSHLDGLIALQEKMEKALSQWKKMPDKLPSGDSICHLIESFEDV